MGESHRETEFFSLVQERIFSRAVYDQNWKGGGSECPIIGDM